MIISGQAFVLRNFFPKKHKLILLHETFGKIHCYVHAKHHASRLYNGSFITIHMHKKHHNYRIDTAEIEFSPFEQGLHDIYFIHDLLKICLEAAPYYTKLQDVFDFLLHVYGQCGKLSLQQQKKYILKLFLMVGVFPEDPVLYRAIMQDVSADKKQYDALLEKGLQVCWALYEQHRHAKDYFLKE